LNIIDGVTIGLIPDSDNPLFGEEFDNSLVVTHNAYQLHVINGLDYYIEVFTGTAGTECCSNLIGTLETTGTYTSAGFAIILVNGLDRFVQIYTKT